MIGFVSFSGIGSDKGTGGIEIYYKNKIQTVKDYIFFTNNNTNTFDKKNFATYIYLTFFRRNINDFFLRSHIDWYFKLYTAMKKYKNVLEYVEVADSFGYGIIPYILKIPYIVKTHCPHSVKIDLNHWEMNKWNKRITKIEKKALRNAKKIISPSKAMLDYLLSHKWKLNTNKCFILQNGYYAPHSHLTEKKNQILFVGNLEPQKNLELLVKTYLNHSEFNKYELIICGSDRYIFNAKTKKNESYWNYLVNKYPQIKNSNIKYLGFIQNDKLIEYYSLAKIIVVPSTEFENFPTVILEGFNNDAIVFGARTGGIPEMIQDEKTGFLFKDQDETTLFECLLKYEKLSNAEIQQIIYNAHHFISIANKQIEKKYLSFL